MRARSFAALIAVGLGWALGAAADGPLRVGIYSGTFDPPHEGHTNIVVRASGQLRLDDVIILPNPETPHKENALPYRHRRAMAEMAFDGGNIRMADDDLVHVSRHAGMNGVIRKIMGRYPAGTQFYRIFGEDSFHYHYTDRSSAMTAKNLTIVVSRRPEGDEEFKALPKFVGQSPIVLLEDGDRISSSSTAVRKALREGKRPEYLAEHVWEYILRENLYQAMDAWKVHCPTFLQPEAK